MGLLDYLPAGRQPEPDLASASPDLLRRRGIATLIDVVVCYVLETPILAFVMVINQDVFVDRPGTTFLLSIVGIVPVYLVYAFCFEWVHGWTMGKKRMDVRVVMDDGEELTIPAVAIRNALRYVDWLPVGYVVGYVLARRSPAGKRLGDRLAGTVVVRPDRTGEPLRAEEE